MVLKCWNCEKILKSIKDKLQSKFSECEDCRYGCFCDEACHNTYLNLNKIKKNNFVKHQLVQVKVK